MCILVACKYNSAVTLNRGCLYVVMMLLVSVIYPVSSAFSDELCKCFRCMCVFKNKRVLSPSHFRQCKSHVLGAVQNFSTTVLWH